MLEQSSIQTYRETVGTESYQPLSDLVNKIKSCQTKSESLKFVEDTAQSSKPLSETNPASLPQPASTVAVN